MAQVLASRLDEFAELETLDTGKPFQHARGEVSGCVAYFDYYAGVADKIPAGLSTPRRRSRPTCASLGSRGRAELVYRLGIAKEPEPALQRLVEPEVWQKCPSAPAT